MGNKIWEERVFQIILAIATIFIASFAIPIVFENHERNLVISHLNFEINSNLDLINFLKSQQEEMANSPLFTPLRLRYTYLERSLDFFDNETIWVDVSDTIYNIKSANSLMDVIRELDTNNLFIYSTLKKQDVNVLINGLSGIESNLRTIKSIIN